MKIEPLDRAVKPLKTKAKKWLEWGTWFFLIIISILLFFQYQKWMNPAIVQSLPAIECDGLNLSCAGKFDVGTISYQMNSNESKILALSTITVKVQLSDDFDTSSQVQIDLLGLNEDMGLVRSHLMSLGNGLFQAEVYIPICVQAEMKWQSRVWIKQSSGIYESRFNFTSYNKVDLEGEI